MILFSPKKLEDQLANGSLSSWEKAKYLFLASVLAALSGPVYWLSPAVHPVSYDTIKLIQNLSAIIGLLITYRGLKKCYSTNDKKEQFIELFICLRVPWTALFTVILTPISLILIYCLKQIFTDNRDIPFLVISISAPFVVFTYYHFLNRSFCRLNHIRPGGEGPTTASDAVG